MNLIVGICDDDNLNVNHLKELVSKWSNNKYNINFKLFNSAESFLFDYEDNTNYDILLLDIEMYEISGVDLAKKIRRKDKLVQIIFITGYLEYIQEGYEVQALNYLMKPIDENKLFNNLDRAIESLNKKSKSILIESKSQTVNILLDNIKYIEALKNYISIFEDNEYTIRMTLSNIEEQLDERFIKIGRSVIVNLTKIKLVTKEEIILLTNEKIILPKGYYDKVNKALINL